jgi:hypothetical protein
MANSAKALFRGAATTTTSTTLYTVPSSTTTIVTNIIVTNTAATDGTFTLSLDDVALASGVVVPAKGIFTLDVKQVLATTDTIKGGANATSISFHISGMEIA